MLSEEGCKRRRARLWEIVPKEVSWLVVADPRHVNYLAGFWINPVSFSFGERAILLLERDGRGALACDNFASDSSIGKPFADQVVVGPWYDHRHSVPNRDHVLFDAFAKIANRLRGGRGLVEAEWLPLGAYRELARIDRVEVSEGPSLGGLLRSLRRTKEADEIEVLKRCMRAGEAGHRRALEIVGPGLSEIDLYREVQSAVVAEAGEPVLVYGDFRATSAAVPNAGGRPTEYRLREGDLFILDFSVVLAGYRSDFTNTIPVGAPNHEQRRLFDLCSEALASGEEALKAGARAADVYRATSTPLAAAGYSLIHHAGHGIGMEHPEAPAFVPESDEVLRSGEVVTLEPGLYVEGVGGMRIERNYLVGESAATVLSRHELRFGSESRR